MKVIGITGGIASGKSTVCSYIKDKYQAYIFDADKEAKKLLQSELVHEEIQKAFPGIKDLSKKSIADEAFKDQESQKKLNDIIHPIIGDIIFERINQKNSLHKFFLVDAALIIESGIFTTYQKNGAKLILVVADKDIRLNRAMERGTLSEKTINDRIKLQMQDNLKVKYADFIIENNSEQSELFNKVDQIMEKIIHE
tara:strand:+ start:2513 stop:3103 length:591 start_codon:yes stop_codon:yes gene_type:complete